MKEKLIMLQNTLDLIETRGKNTLLLADCMRYLANIINELEEKDEQNE